LAALAKKCLSPDRDARPRDAGQVAAEVAALRSAAEERARAAEVERARAEGRTAEERQRRKAQLFLLGSILVFGLLGAAGATWYLLDREKRTSARTREMAEVGAVITNSIEQAYRDANAGRWREAEISLKRAEDRLAGNGNWPGEFELQILRARAD